MPRASPLDEKFPKQRITLMITSMALDNFHTTDLGGFAT